MRIILALTLVLIAGIYAEPCNRCLWEGAYCGGSSGGTCSSGLTCQSLKNGAAPVCLPTVEPGEACNDKAYDPCPPLYSCDTDLKVCILNAGLAFINDGCNSDDDCRGTLSCANDKCVNDDPDTYCNSISVGCPIGQYCDSTGENPKCVEQKKAGGECDGDDGKCYMGSCINNACVDHFSAVSGSICKSENFDCKTGLTCERRGNDEEKKCYEPLYLYIQPTGFSKWGPECNADKGDPGCKCNKVSQFEQYEIERLVNKKEPCEKAYKTHIQCLKDNTCYFTGTFGNSCMRNNCWGEYIDRSNQCNYEGLNPVRCGANEMMLALIMIVAFLFLH